MKTLLSTAALLMTLAACSDAAKPADSAPPSAPSASAPSAPPSVPSAPPVVPVSTPAATAADIKPENAKATADALAKEIDADKD